MLPVQGKDKYQSVELPGSPENIEWMKALLPGVRVRVTWPWAYSWGKIWEIT